MRWLHVGNKGRDIQKCLMHAIISLTLVLSIIYLSNYVFMEWLVLLSPQTDAVKINISCSATAGSCSSYLVADPGLGVGKGWPPPLLT